MPTRNYFLYTSGVKLGTLSRKQVKVTSWSLFCPSSVSWWICNGQYLSSSPFKVGLYSSKITHRLAKKEEQIQNFCLYKLYLPSCSRTWVFESFGAKAICASKLENNLGLYNFIQVVVYVHHSWYSSSVNGNVNSHDR